MPQNTLSPTLRNPITIGTLSPESLSVPLNAAGATFAVSTAWPLPSGAIFVPIEIMYPVTVAKMMVNNGTSLATNIDAGIYDLGGTRLVSIGSVIHSGTSTIQIFDIADTYLLPGLYYLGVALSNTSGTLAGFNASAAVDATPMGLYQQAGAFPLPATASFSMFTGTFIPLVNMAIQSVI